MFKSARNNARDFICMEGDIKVVDHLIRKHQKNMFSPPPQPKIPLKMQILSENAISVTEGGNFYPNN